MTVLQPQAKQKHGLLNIVHLQFTKALERGREGGWGKGKEGEKKRREEEGVFTCTTICCSTITHSNTT